MSITTFVMGYIIAASLYDLLKIGVKRLIRVFITSRSQISYFAEELKNL